MPHFVSNLKDRLDNVCMTPRCPGPTVGIVDHSTGIVDLLIITKPRSVIEIGCWNGVSTEVFLLMVPRVATVDPFDYPSDRANLFRERCGGYSNLEVYPGYSPEELQRFGDEEFDMCYIDGDHSYEAVKADIAACHRIVKMDGWVCGHDWHHTPVKRAVYEVTDDNNILVFRDMSWAIIRHAVRVP